MQENQ
jgi:hypothetical protein